MNLTHLKQQTSPLTDWISSASLRVVLAAAAKPMCGAPLPLRALYGKEARLKAGYEEILVDILKFLVWLKTRYIYLEFLRNG